MEAISKTKNSDIDGGYAWIILFSCFTTIMLCVGNTKAYGILYTEMIEYYVSGSGEASWIGSLYLFSVFGIGPIGNFFGRKYTFRVVGFTGGVITAIGFLSSGFVKRIEYMYLTFLCIGIGMGLSATVSITINSFYFAKHRSLANGIVSAGSGFGAISLSFLYKFLIDRYSLRGAMWVISGCMANICVAACLLRQPKVLVDEKRKTKKKEEQDETLIKQQKNQICNGIDLNFSLFKNPLYTMYFFAFFFSMSGFAGNIILIPAQVKTLGYDKTHASLAVSIMGGCEIVSRILTGWFSDLNIVRRKTIFSVNMFIGAVIAFIAPFFDSFTFMALYAAGVGIFPGTFWALMPDLIIGVVGLEKLAAAFGFVWMGLGLGSCICMPVVGWLQDIYGNWVPSFVFTGCLHVLAGSVVLFEPIIVRCQSQPAATEEENGSQSRTSHVTSSQVTFTRTDEDLVSCASKNSVYL